MSAVVRITSGQVSPCSLEHSLRHPVTISVSSRIASRLEDVTRRRRGRTEICGKPDPGRVGSRIHGLPVWCRRRHPGDVTSRDGHETRVNPGDARRLSDRYPRASTVDKPYMALPSRVHGQRKSTVVSRLPKTVIVRLGIHRARLVTPWFNRHAVDPPSNRHRAATPQLPTRSR